MDTNKYTATRKMANGKKIEVTVENGTWTEEIRLDGQATGTYNTHIVSTKEIVLRDENGKVIVSSSEIKPMSYAKIHYSRQYPEAVEAGCVGMIDRAFIKQDTYDMVMSAIAEAEAAAPKTGRQIEIEAAKAKAQSDHDAWYNSPEEVAYRKFTREMEREDSDY
jgi:hypothetical protein